MRICIFDLEADGLLKEATVTWCGVFKDINTKELTKFRPDQIPDMLAFMDSCDVLIGHNIIGYDFPLLRKLYGYEYQGKKVDTVLMSRLQQPNRPRPWGMLGKAGPHSVEAWGYRFGRAKPEHEDWSQFSDGMLHRCTEDVEIQHLIYIALLEEASGYEWRDAWLLNFKLFEIVQRQEQHGWLVDMAHMERCQYFLTRWMDKLRIGITPMMPSVMIANETKDKGEYKYVKKPFLASGKPNARMVTYWGDDVHLVGGQHSRIGFRPVSVDKSAEVKDYLLSIGWIPAVWNVSKKTGEQTGPKLNSADPFEGVEGRIGKSLAKYVVFKDRFSTIKGWIERTRDDGRLESRISGVATTGRAKHSNIANVPNCETFFGKWMRKCFTAPEGKVLIGCDSSNCQVRMLAERAKDDEFKRILLEGTKENGDDGHSLIMHAVNRAHTQLGFEHISRGKAKNYSFAHKFGASDNKLGAMSGSNEAAGKLIRAEIDNEFSAQAAVVETLTEEWRSNAQVEEKWGKKRYKNGWIRGLDGRPIFIESEHAILVYMLQSDEAIVMSAAYVILYKRLLSAGYEWGKHWAYVCFYHDEYTIECNEDLAHIISPMAEQAITDAGKFYGITYCEQQGEAEVGKNWYEIH